MPLITNTPYKANFETTISGDSPYWWFRLDETSGTTAVDKQGVANGSYANIPTLNQTGLVNDNNTAVLFTRSQTEYVTMLSTGKIGQLSNHSIEAWVKPNAVPPGGQGYPIYSENDPGGVIYTLVLASSGFFEFSINSATVWHTAQGSAVSVVGGNTYHVVATMHSVNGMTIYVNGSSAGTDPNTGVNTSNINTREIASYDVGPSPGQFFDGVIDEVIAYNYTLTADQISNHHSFTV